MKKKLSQLTVLIIATSFIVGCDDNNNSQISSKPQEETKKIVKPQAPSKPQEETKKIVKPQVPSKPKEELNKIVKENKKPKIQPKQTIVYKTEQELAFEELENSTSNLNGPKSQPYKRTKVHDAFDELEREFN